MLTSSHQFRVEVWSPQKPSRDFRYGIWKQLAMVALGVVFGLLQQS